MIQNHYYYFLTFIASLLLSLVFTPAARSAAVVLNIFDHPVTSVKTHKQPVPYLGGVAIFLAFTFSLLWIRVLTSFPTGTLRSLRGILLGGGLVCLMGLVDDVKHLGLHYRTKFMIQTLAALLLITFGIRIKFIAPSWLGIFITIVWVVGVTNAFNLIDIMDGLASGVIVVCSLAFLLISLPTEEIYVNFAASALCGAALGFMPYNLSKPWRLFMGDSGSLFLGFVASSLSLGTSYTGKTELGILTPVIILAIPLFDTLLVFYCRIKKGVSPFIGSKDHFALRMESMGWKRRNILAFTLIFASLLCVCASFITESTAVVAVSLYMLVAVALGIFTAYVLKINVR